MQDFRLITIQLLVLTFTVVLGGNPALLNAMDDGRIERNCLKSVFDEYVRPLLATTTNSNGKIFVNLPSSRSNVRNQDFILKMFHRKFAVIMNNWQNENEIKNNNTYVLFCTHLAEVTDMIERLKLRIGTWNSTSSVIIFFKDTSESFWKIRRILMIFIHSNVLNVHVISIGIKKIDVVTFPYIDRGCGKYIRNVQIAAECNMETSRYRVMHSEVNINKVQNRCPFKVVSLEWTPFSSFNSKIGNYEGFEVDLLKAYADKMHFEPIMIGPSNSTLSINELLRNG